MLKLNHLHGFNKQRARPLRELDYVDNAFSSNSTTVDLTALAPRHGDLLVLLWHAEDGTNWVLPSGWTFINEIDDAREMAAAYKISNGTETSVTVAHDSFTDTQVMLFRGDVPILSVTAAGYQAVVTSGNPANHNIASGSGTAPVLVIADFTASGGTDEGDIALSPTTGASSTGFAYVETSGADLAAFAIWEASPINTACDVGDRGSFTGMQSFYLSLA